MLKVDCCFNKMNYCIHIQMLIYARIVFLWNIDLWFKFLIPLRVKCFKMSHTAI